MTRDITETNQLLRVTFMQEGGDDSEKIYLPTVRRQDFFQDEIYESNEAFFSSVFNETNGLWVCPDTSSLTLLNSEKWLQVYIFPCETAEKLVDSPAYSGQTCASYEDTQSSFDDGQY